MTEAGRTAAERRGRLKLFVSYAPGAGKTCAMLKQALRQKGQGTDVAAGVVDPHGHACTARLLAAPDPRWQRTEKSTWMRCWRARQRWYW